MFYLKLASLLRSRLAKRQLMLMALTVALAQTCALFFAQPLSAFAQSIEIEGSAEAESIEDSASEDPAGEEPTGIELLREAAFNPPRNPRRRRGGRTTTGTRQDSCVGESVTAFTAIGPEATAGLTVSTRPTFVWHLPESAQPYPVTFRLLALDENDRLTLAFREDDLDYVSGYTAYSLPAEAEALDVGQRYRWQVIVQCDANYPSRSLVQEISLEVVETPEGLDIDTVQDAAERALRYGRAGLWYDAIAQVADAQTSSQRAVRQQLIQDLARLEAENATLSENLLDIAEHSY